MENIIKNNNYKMISQGYIAAVFNVVYLLPWELWLICIVELFPFHPLEYYTIHKSWI